MSSVEELKPGASRLYIGEGVTIKGEISVPDTLVVCGTVEGDVSVGNLVVGETGVIKGRDRRCTKRRDFRQGLREARTSNA